MHLFTHVLTILITFLIHSIQPWWLGLLERPVIILVPGRRWIESRLDLIIYLVTEVCYKFELVERLLMRRDSSMNTVYKLLMS